MGRCVVTVKLTATELLALDQLVSRWDYFSRSDAIRDSLRQLFEARAIKLESKDALRLEKLASPPRRTRAQMEAGVKRY